MGDREEMGTLMQTFTVKFGGGRQQVHKKPILQHEELMLQVSDLVAEAIELAEPEIRAGVEARIKGAVTSGLDLGPAIVRAIPFFLGKGRARILKLLYLYAPELEPHKDKATDEEVVGAIMEVVKILYPLAQRIGSPVLEYAQRQAERLAAKPPKITIREPEKSPGSSSS